MRSVPENPHKSATSKTEPALVEQSGEQETENWLDLEWNVISSHTTHASHLDQGQDNMFLLKVYSYHSTQQDMA